MADSSFELDSPVLQTGAFTRLAYQPKNALSVLLREAVTFSYQNSQDRI